MQMTIGLYLMTEKGLAVLEAALEANVEIAHVTTASATGMNDNSHETISLVAKQHGIPTFLRSHPPSYTSDLSVAAGWRWMLDVPELVVLHDSLLPRYRGYSPLITALANGDPEVGVTAFVANDVPDTGPIVAQRRLPLAYPVRMRQVLKRLVPLYKDLASEVLREDRPLRYFQQDHAKATYSLWRDDHDYRIDWTADDRTIVRLVDAASEPFPGAWTTADGNRVVIDYAETVTDVRFEQRHPGKVAWKDEGTVVVCGTGLVRIPNAVPTKTRFV